MKLGVVSDTHDDSAVVQAAVDQFEAAGVDTVVHCGDFVAPFSATPFEGEWDFAAVRGNNDGEWGLQTVVDEFGTYLGEMGELQLDGHDIAVYHGTSAPIVDALVDCGNYAYVLHGHTHQRAHEQRGDTVRINPGGIALAGAPDPPAAVVVDLDDDTVSFTDLP